MNDSLKSIAIDDLADGLSFPESWYSMSAEGIAGVINMYSSLTLRKACFQRIVREECFSPAKLAKIAKLVKM